MTERLELYKCDICGNLAEVILPGVGALVCCNQNMRLLEPHKDDSEFSEKHVPVFSATSDDGVEIRVGTALHPMTEEHYIQFIESVSDGKNHTELQYYNPLDIPVMLLKDKLGLERARAFCNIHGLWEAKYE